MKEWSPLLKNLLTFQFCNSKELSQAHCPSVRGASPLYRLYAVEVLPDTCVGTAMPNQGREQIIVTRKFLGSGCKGRGYCVNRN